jgi:hypothetical protein
VKGETVFVRDAGVGYHIDIESTTETTVRLAVMAGNGKIVLDSFDVPREKALDAIHHPALYSAKYREALV